MVLMGCVFAEWCLFYSSVPKVLMVSAIASWALVVERGSCVYSPTELSASFTCH
jgi:hypothetical protein